MINICKGKKNTIINLYLNLKVIDYNWLKAEYMKKPEEMDKTGDECWFNRFSVTFIISVLKVSVSWEWDNKICQLSKGIINTFSRYKTNEFRNLRSVFKLPQERVKMQSGGPWLVFLDHQKWARLPSIRYVGWSVCHEEVAEEMYKLIEVPF